MKTAYSLYKNNLAYFIFCYKNSLYISPYPDKHLCNELKIKLFIQTGPIHTPYAKEGID